MMMRPMAFGFDGVHNFDGSRISEVGQRQAPQLNLNMPEIIFDGPQVSREEAEASARAAYAQNPRANQRVKPQLPQEISPIPQQSQQPIAQQPYTQSPFSFGLGSLGYGGFSPYGGGFSPFGMMGGYGGMGAYGGGYGGMIGGFSPFGGYGGGYGGMMGGFSPFGGYGGFSPFGGYGGGIYNLPQAQQAPQQQQAAQPVQQQANPFGNSIKQQYAQPAMQGGLFQ